MVIVRNVKDGIKEKQILYFYGKVAKLIANNFRAVKFAVPQFSVA